MISLINRRVSNIIHNALVPASCRRFSTNRPDIEETSETVELKDESPPSPSDEDVSFDTLLRNSPFMWLGDFEGRIVQGTINRVFDDDLYIDFGGKFECVCKRPRNGIHYVRGSKVRLRLNDWELAARFLGSSRDMTLMEADCTLLGLISSPSLPPDSTEKTE
ncbi:mitochondrial ribosomal protein S28 [Brevipalpus obovatus]|uniref:mitochondrial ribosomal protein S28 n=1 Tax=Brevipalpus obovatus TaxID=246614 RepID=UPI003D9FABAF